MIRLTPLEIAAGFPFGFEDPPETDGAPARGAADVVAAFEAALLPALQRAPCLVTFSGGRDSSLVLAAATRLADRCGLPRPIPLTCRYPGVERATETEWQELVIRHVGVHDWEKLEITDQFDLVGDLAQRLFRTWGPIWPPLAYQDLPVFERARRGSVLTGEGGDEALGENRATSARNLWVYRRAAGWQDLKIHGEPLLPRFVRRRRAYRAHREALPWLEPEARRAAARQLAEQEVGEPLDWPRAVRRAMTRRAGTVGIRNLSVIAADYDCAVVHPIRDPRFLSSLGSLAGRWGYRDRGSLLRAVFGDLLPDSLTRRSTKAYFNEVAFNVHSRSFAATWTGRIDLVDPVALRREWQRESVSARTFMLLQQAFVDQAS